MLTCTDCGGEIRGDHMRADEQPIHIRCMRKRIEQQPNFICWGKAPGSTPRQPT